MKIFKHFTIFRLYLAICVLSVSAFTYAEYYGYVLTGSDESQREHSNSIHGGTGYTSVNHHK